MEQHAQTSDKTFGNGARFRKDRPSYKDMHEFAIKQQDLFDVSEETIPCYCGD